MPQTPYLLALHALERIINQLKREHIRRLPATRALAGQIGVSRRTLDKAIHHLCEQGVLERASRRRTVICTKDTHDRPVDDQTSPVWRNIARQLADDTLADYQGPGQVLPSQNQLMRRFHVSRPVVVQALNYLAGNRIIEQQGSRYRVRGPQVRGSGEVILVTRGYSGNTIMSVGPHQAEMLRVLDDTCTRAGVSLVPSFMRWQNQSFVADEDWGVPAAANSHRGTILGFVVLRVGLQTDVGPVVRTLQTNNVPVAVIDETPGRERASVRGTRTAPVLWVHATADRQAGHDIGTYLLDRGHRRAVFVATDDDTYARLRCQGLRDAFDAAGLAGAIRYVRCPPQQPRRQRWVATTRYESHTLIDNVRKALNAALSRAGRRTRLTPGAVDGLYGPLYAGWESSLIPNLVDYAELLASLLDDTEATVWVCRDQGLACTAVDFLRILGLDVPRDKSIVCFEDSTGTFNRRITAYNFHPADTARTALSAVLGTGRPWLRMGGVSVHETAGAVVERASVAELGPTRVRYG